MRCNMDILFVTHVARDIIQVPFYSNQNRPLSFLYFYQWFDGKWKLCQREIWNRWKLRWIASPSIKSLLRWNLLFLEFFIRWSCFPQNVNFEKNFFWNDSDTPLLTIRPARKCTSDTLTATIRIHFWQFEECVEKFSLILQIGKNRSRGCPTTYKIA